MSLIVEKSKKNKFSSFRGNIIISFIGISMLLLALAGWWFVQLQGIATVRNQLIEISKPTQTNIYALRHAISKTDKALENYLLYTDEKYELERDNVWKKDIKNILDTLAIFEKEWQNVENRVLFSKATSKLKILNKTQAAIRDTLKANVKRQTQDVGDDAVVFEMSVEQLMDSASAAKIQAIAATELPVQAQAMALFKEKSLPLSDEIETDLDNLYKIFEKQINLDNAQLQNATFIFQITAIFSILIFIVIIFFVAQQIIRKNKQTMQLFSSYLAEFAKGNIPEIKERSVGETEEILNNMKDLSQNLKAVKKFAEKASSGEFDIDIAIFDNEGEIGNSLANMRKELQQISEEDRKRNWVNEGLALFADILRQAEDIQKLYDTLISSLINYVKGNQGGIFIINIKDQDDPFLELKSFYAYERKKYIQRRIEIGQGLVGQCWQERQSILLTKVPKDYIKVTSGLGEETPSCVLVVPMIANKKVIGVIEIASFHIFTETEVKLIESLAEDTASTISTTQVNDQTKRLLEDSQRTTHIMQEQEEEMRQNVEELSAIQEELERQTREMSQMMDTVNKTAVIMEFDQEGKFTYANPKFCEISQYSEDEVLWRNINFNIDPNDFDPAEFNTFWNQLLQGKSLQRVSRRLKQDGELFWLRSTFFPIFDEDGNLTKITCVGVDITDDFRQKGELVESQRLLEAKDIAFDRSFLVIETDTDFVIQDINSFGIDLLQKPKEQLIRLHLIEIMVNAINFKEVAQIVQEEKIFEGEIVVRNEQAQEKFLRITCVGVENIQHQIEKLIWIGTDITLLREQEQALVEKVQVLEQTLQEKNSGLNP